MLIEVKYDDSDNDRILDKLSGKEFSSDSWSDKDLEDLKDKIKKHYIKVQKNICPYCRQSIKSKNGRVWDVEHIIPRSLAPGFMFEPKNLCVACLECNSAKSDKKVVTSKAKKTYPTKSHLFTIIHPHFDNYNEHILVIKEGFYYVALHSKGEKTIEVCKLNRFYEYSDFGSSVQDDNRIFMLSEALKNTEDDLFKRSLRREIAALAIKGAAEV